MSKTILITGATGFAGSYATSYYLRCGYTVVAMLHDNYSLSAEERESRIRVQQYSVENKNKNNPKLHFMRGSLDDVDDIAEKLMSFGVNVVLHLAGESSVLRAENNPNQALATNVQGTYNVASAAECVAQQIGIKIRFIFVSSIRVLKLHASTDNACVYDQSKLLAERELCNIKNIPIDIVYCSHLFGPGDSNTLVSSWIRKALNKEAMAIQASQDLEVELLSLEGFCEQAKQLIDCEEYTVNQRRIVMKHEYVYSLKEISDIICECADRIAYENLKDDVVGDAKELKNIVSHRQLVKHEQPRKF